MAALALAMLGSGPLASAACFSVSFEDGEISCAGSQLCPNGLSCQDGVCRQPRAIDAAPADGVDAPIGSLPPSCKGHLEAGETTSGVYSIDPPPAGDPLDVYCEMTIDGGGWTVLVNNDNADQEPTGCRPRIATTAALECGSPASGADFSTPTAGVGFNQMLFAAYAGGFDNVTSYRLFEWNAAATLPATELWELVPDESDDVLDSLVNTPIITCSFAPIGPPGLRRVFNGTPRVDTGNYVDTDVVTFLDQDLISGNPGNLTFSEADAANGSLNGLDDFQDGFGCQDDWSPLSDRGSSAFIAVR